MTDEKTKVSADVDLDKQISGLTIEGYPKNHLPPPPQQPLTDDELDEIFDSLIMNMVGYTVLNNVIIRHLLGEKFKSEESLKSLLNAVLTQAGQPLVKRVEILSVENLPEHVDEKITFLDVKAEDEKGTLFNVEIQLLTHPGFISRLVYYGAGLYTSQLKSGDDYPKLNPAICVVITLFDLFPEYKDLFLSFRLHCDQHPELVLTNDVQFYIVRVADLDSNPSAKMELTPELKDWIYFLNFPKTNVNTMKQIVAQNLVLGHTAQNLAFFVSNREERERIEREEKNRRDYVALTEGAFDNGLENGRVEIILNNLENSLGIQPPKSVGIKLRQLKSPQSWQEISKASFFCKSLEEFSQTLEEVIASDRK